MRHGATLPELLAAMALLGILAAIAVPPAGAARDRALLLLHARALAAAHADTRSAALRAGARTELSVSPMAYEQRSLAGTVLWRRPGPAQDGVDLIGPLTPIVFDSRGYTLGAANRTYRLIRGSREVRVIMSRLGRLRVVQ
ncbi:MAG: prepilin-type N-terminal cleavage/methylation domain-containing protein [Gemmatimonadales bacterium]